MIRSRYGNIIKSGYINIIRRRFEYRPRNPLINDNKNMIKNLFLCLCHHVLIKGGDTGILYTACIQICQPKRKDSQKMKGE